ncbi:LacI family DNA-binding transcriptional regulator [Hoeflea prorocentri]|uniref:LacI family DNA-binding transcriptional regulator n=1 Tax=Hoeflea prorocentri TaxID=1922333 RepID=A0A9X3UEX7_9HYPH|nr:LacI family DNA-binding transcriptional regulator [Hoeflea prorocentri]MCY6379615.1 LacI family DNA-binding transcriptional regulator [Hoeflea prorocentri]MDA5397415.1 LacI family DNA-binding transcriptional regulator [Hoeflea prorocentri]
MAKVGIKHLAEELNVDVSTVSRALRNDPRVKPETTRMVQNLAKKLGYRPNSAARALRGGKTGRVAVLLSPPQQRFASPVFLELLATLDGYLRQEKMSLAVFAARDWDEEVEIVRSVVDDRMADAIILGRTRVNDERIRYLLDQNVPFVSFGRSSWPDEHSWVEIDYLEAGQIAVSALSENRPDSLTIVAASEGLRFADNFVRGALDEARGRDLDDIAVRRVEMSESEGERLAKEVLTEASRSAFACIQDSLAFGFYRGAAQQERKIGREIALFGGQNFPGAEHTAPPLSTFSTQDKKVADLLSRVMIRRLGSEGASAPQHHTVSPEPLLRSSHFLE